MTTSTKQNCHIWSEDQPEALQVLPMHPEKVTVWCGLWAGGNIGPYFFKGDDGRNVTVNGERYRVMIDDFCLPKMKELDMPDMWFQQDGATCHTARETITKLRADFGVHFISRSGPVNWQPRSCDLTPSDFFLWGYVKAHVYRDKPATIDALKANIEEFIREIPDDMLKRMCQNWTLRMGHLQRSGSQHLHEIIFKH